MNIFQWYIIQYLSYIKDLKYTFSHSFSFSLFIRDLHFVEIQNPNTPMRVVSKICKQMEKEHFRILKMKIFMFFFLFLFYFWKIQKKNFIKMKNWPIILKENDWNWFGESHFWRKEIKNNPNFLVKKRLKIFYPEKLE